MKRNNNNNNNKNNNNKNGKKRNNGKPRLMLAIRPKRRPQSSSSSFSQTISRAPVNRSYNIRSRPKKSPVFQHTEIIFESLNGQADGGFLPYFRAINPGLSSLFPWLAQMASLYNNYVVEAMRFRFVPTVSTVFPGTISMAFDFDVYGTVPDFKSTFMMSTNACSANIWKGLSMSLTPQQLRDRGDLYVRSSTISGTDRKTYDLGNLLVGIQGTDTTAPIGDLYCDYTIRFINPIPPLQSAFSVFNTNKGTLTGATPAKPFGTSTSGMTLVSSPGGSFVFGSGSATVLQCKRSGFYKLTGIFEGVDIELNSGGTFTLVASTDFPDNRMHAIADSYISGSVPSGYAVSTAYMALNSFLTVTLSAFTTLLYSIVLIDPMTEDEYNLYLTKVP